jgi:nicotinamide-nucleotide amidase
MKVEVVSVGDELLLGTVVDTNSAYLGTRLAEVGAEVIYKTAVGDNARLIENVVRRALERVDLVIVTGGLGPTRDDITKRTIARIFDKPLVLKDSVLQSVREHFEKRNLEMPAINTNQAMVPEGSVVFANPRGTAPAIVIEEGKSMLVMLPGVPSEMKALFDEHILPLVAQKSEGAAIVHRTLHTVGLTESKIEQMLTPEVRKLSRGELAFLPHHTGVDLRLTAREITKDKASKRLKELERAVGGLLGDAVWGKDEDTLEQVVGFLLSMKHKTVSVAESCTGGLIMDMITNVSGSSSYFVGGVVAYSNEIKMKKLKVSKSLLEKHGAVSSEVAVAMAEGVRKQWLSDIGLSVTGIAGPSGGTAAKPVGLVCIALSFEEDSQVEKHNFLGSRREIKEQAAVAALDLLRRHLLNP